MLRIIFIVMVMATLAGCSGLMGGGGAANKAVAEKYVTAFNAADYKTILDNVTDDFTITPLGAQRTLQGKDTLQDLLSHDFPYGTQIGVEKWSEEGDVVKADVMLTSPKPGALKPTPATYIWTIQGGKIKDLKIAARSS